MILDCCGIRWCGRERRKFSFNDLKIPRLGSYGITEKDFPELVKHAANASSMQANPIALTPEELTGILEAAL